MQAANRLRRATASPAAPPPTSGFVKSLGYNWTTAGATLTLTLTQSVAVGHTVIVVCKGNGGPHASSATDSQGNTYTVDASTSSGNTVSLLHGAVTTALASGDVITVTMNGTGGGGIIAADYAGIATSSAVRGTPATSSSGSGTQLLCPASGGVATTASSDLLIAGLTTGTTVTSIGASSPFTVRATAPWSAGAVGAIADATPGVSAGTQIQWTWTNSSNSTSALAAYISA